MDLCWMQCAASPEAERKICAPILQVLFSQLAEMFMMFAATTELLPDGVHFCTQTNVASGPLQLLVTFNKFLKEILAIRYCTLTTSDTLKGWKKGKHSTSYLPWERLACPGGNDLLDDTEMHWFSHDSPVLKGLKSRENRATGDSQDHEG